MDEKEVIKLVEEMLDRYTNNLRLSGEVRVSFYEAEVAREQTLIFLRKRLGGE